MACRASPAGSHATRHLTCEWVFCDKLRKCSALRNVVATGYVRMTRRNPLSRNAADASGGIVGDVGLARVPVNSIHSGVLGDLPDVRMACRAECEMLKETIGESDAGLYGHVRTQRR
jgi:hypothetical protein